MSLAKDWTFDELSAHLKEWGLDTLCASELHGVFSAACCCGFKGQLGYLVGLLGEETIPEEAMEDLGELYQWTYQSLSAEECSFYPVLPGEEQVVGERFHALQRWCFNFTKVYWLQKAFLESSNDAADLKKQLPVQTQEILDYFVAVSDFQLEEEDLQHTEQTEKSYVELLEFVRVSTLTLFEPMDLTRSA